MTLTLVRKLLRDVRLALTVVAVLLGAFQVLWYKVIDRLLGELAPFFNQLASAGGLSQQDVESVVFDGPGKIVRTIIGGERLSMDRAMDLVSIGYVHPLIQTILCVWAVGRSAGAIAGEIDRGTMELLLAQPLARFRLIVAHLCVDAIAIPVLCLSLWMGNFLGYQLVGPIRLRDDLPTMKLPKPDYLIELGPFRVRMASPLGQTAPTSPEAAERARERLRVEPAKFGPALWSVGGLIFAVSGLTMWLSAAGRFRWRVLGLAVFLTLLQFLVNVVGQLDESFAALRPWTVFYYYRPQEMILGQASTQLPALAVLYGVGALGYAMALVTFARRDVPAPL